MRFRDLQLLRYGRFEDCTLTFPQAACDLHLVFGPNEAGKSTTLQAVGDLLFGFPHVTRFAFRFDRQLLRVGAVIEDDAGAFEVRRRKGNAQTLLGPDDEPIEAGRLAAGVGAQSREGFERMFGLDHQRLREGGQAILDSRDDVGAAIFAAGSGLVRVRDVCDALEQEAKAIWTSRAGETRTYTAAARSHQDARARLRDAQVRPAAWAEARRTLHTADERLKALRAQRAEDEGRARDLERRRRTLAPVARRRAGMEALAELGQTPGLPSGGSDRFEAALRAQERAAADILRADETLTELATALSAAQPNPAALEAQAEIEGLREAKGGRDNGLAVLPRLKASRVARTEQARSLQTEIGWPDEPAETTRARLPGRPLLAEVRDLLEGRSGIDRQGKTAEEALADATASQVRLRAQLEALAAPVDLQPLQARVRALRDEGDLAGRVLAAESVYLELERVRAARLAALAPWTGDVAALIALPLPADEDIEDALGRLSRAEDDAESERSVETRDLERLQQLRLERTQATQEHLAPGLDELVAVRRERDAAWAPLREQLTGGLAMSAPEQAAEAFARKVSQADQMADLRFDQAEHAGRLAALDRQVERAELALAQSHARLTTAEASLHVAAAHFAALVAPLGLPLSATAYEAWRDARFSALEADDALAAAERERSSARAADAEARRSLTDLLGADAPTGASLRTLLLEAERRLEVAATLHARRDALQAQIEAAGLALERAQAQAEAATDASSAWNNAWGQALARLGLPPASAVAGVRARLDLMETLRAELEALSALQVEIAQAEGTVADFDAGVARIAARLAQAPRADAGDTLAVLSDMASAAVVQADRMRDLETRTATALHAKLEAERALAEATEDAQPFLALAADGDPGAVRSLMTRALEAERLRAELQALEREILDLGEGHDLAALIEAARDADPDQLAGEARVLAEQVASLNTEVEAASAARQAADIAFKALNDGPDAAIAAFEMAEARNEMAFQAELYIRKRAEAKLLRAAIDRYRAEKQGPLLLRASQLFRTLTLGRYHQLLVEYEGDAPRLAGLREDGATVVPVDGMSQGTVDQLFLALRVAAVEDAVAQGARLPFLADDLFINFDDARAAAGFQVLAELGRQTQVLFFTHHEHLIDVARTALGQVDIAACSLPMGEGGRTGPVAD